MFKFFYGSLRPLEWMPWILLFCIFGDFYASGIQDAEVNTCHCIFFCMDKRLLEDFVLKCNQWKYWMSFIACGCPFSRSYTVYSWVSKGWLLGIWAYQTMEWFPWVTTKQRLTIAQLPIPKATFIKPAVHVCSVCIRSWLFTCTKLNGSFENEALENEDRSTKHPNLENKAPLDRKRRPLDRKRSTLSRKRRPQNLENEAPKTRKRRPLNLENEAPKTRNHCRFNKCNLTSYMTQSESGGGSGCVRTSKGPQNPNWPAPVARWEQECNLIN